MRTKNCIATSLQLIQLFIFYFKIYFKRQSLKTYTLKIRLLLISSLFNYFIDITLVIENAKLLSENSIYVSKYIYLSYKYL